MSRGTGAKERPRKNPGSRRFEATFARKISSNTCITLSRNETNKEEANIPEARITKGSGREDHIQVKTDHRRIEEETKGRTHRRRDRARRTTPSSRSTKEKETSSSYRIQEEARRNRLSRDTGDIHSRYQSPEGNPRRRLLEDSLARDRPTHPGRRKLSRPYLRTESSTRKEAEEQRRKTNETE